MNQDPYIAPLSADEPEFINLSKPRNWAIFFTMLLWSAVAFIFLSGVGMLALVFIGAYSMVLLFIAIGASERYLKKSKNAERTGHTWFARLLYMINCLPIVLAVLKSIGVYA